MNEFKEKTKARTVEVAIQTLIICNDLPKTLVNVAIAKQLVRSVTSVGANYRAACRAKSRADFVNKLHIVEEECDESIFWVELLERIQPERRTEVCNVRNELNEILAIVVTALKTTKYGGEKVE
jgi:four helix bundle protein